MHKQCSGTKLVAQSHKLYDYKVPWVNIGLGKTKHVRMKNNTNGASYKVSHIRRSDGFTFMVPRKKHIQLDCTYEMVIEDNPLE
jgi:hypothetical protein